VAPGESLVVAFPTGVFPSGYATVSGTSFSAPHASGALALLRSAVPLATPAELEQALLGTSTDLGPLGADNSYGRGMINLPAAYARLTAQPFLAVYDPAAPENDDRLDFGSITPGTVRELDFVLKNAGAADLVINNISSSSTTALPLVANTCPATLLPGAQCTLTVRFAPTAFTSSVAQINITSNDPRQPQRTLAVAGIGNSLPPPAQLLTPANNANFLVSPVTFSWHQPVDPDGDALTQTLLIDTDPHFDPPARTIFAAAGRTPAGVLVATIGLFLWPRSGQRRRQLLIAGGLVLLGLLVACGGGGGGTTIAPTNSIAVNNLAAATTHYWKVRSVDTHGGVSESEVRSFTTR
jgi:hypothetical protein